LATGNTTLHSSPANRATAAPAAPKPPAVTPPPVPAPAAASQQTIRDFAELALHLASLAGPLTVEHRLLITRAAETIADLFEKDWRELRLHERETAATEPPLNLCSRLAQLPLRERENSATCCSTSPKWAEKPPRTRLFSCSASTASSAWKQSSG